MASGRITARRCEDVARWVSKRLPKLGVGHEVRFVPRNGYYALDLMEWKRGSLETVHVLACDLSAREAYHRLHGMVDALDLISDSRKAKQKG